MKKNILVKMFIIVFAILFIFVLVPKNALAITPGDITGDAPDDTEIEIGFAQDTAGLLRKIGSFIAVGAMMIIGIKYMTGSIEEKANYKKTMVPYIIGCVILFSASIIAPTIINMFSEAKTADDIGNAALGVIQVIGTVLAVGVLMVLGIKYMLGSIEERASYKKSMLPYFIGAILVFGAVNITAVVANMATIQDDGSLRAQEFIKSVNGDIDQIKEERRKATEKARQAEKTGIVDKKEQDKLWRYADALQDYIQSHK